MSRRILVIDCQILQTAAFDRGMGKYTVNLIREALVQNRVSKLYDDVNLIFNSDLRIGSRIDDISKIIDDKSAKHYFIKLGSDIDKGGVVEKEKVAQRELEKFIGQHYSVADDVTYLITAPFFVGFPSVFPCGANIKKAAIVYDITPQKIRHLQMIFPDGLYFNHYHIFTEADILLSISAAVAMELIEVVGVPAEKIRNIDGGPMAMNSAAEDTGIFRGEYILMVTGNIIHKNNERAVRAFHKFNQRHRNKYHLYITSEFGEGERKKLNGIDKRVVFTGNIADAELAYGYQNAAAVLFPSLAEGLGMPVLEAALYGTPVACSDIPVLSELGNNAFELFNPRSVNDMARGLTASVYGNNRESKRRALEGTARRYTWPRTSKLLLEYCSEAKRMERQSRAVSLSVWSVGDDSPAAYLTNYLYMYLSSYCADIVLFEDRGAGDGAAIARHLQVRRSVIQSDHGISEEGLADIRIENKPRLFLHGGRKIVVRFRGKEYETSARRVYDDKALRMRGWSICDRQGIINFVMENLA